MVEVITIAIVGMGLIFVMAGVVGVIDAARASAWRAVAAERRQSWEDRSGEERSRRSSPDPVLPA